jgi:hypothetical protein
MKLTVFATYSALCDVNFSSYQKSFARGFMNFFPDQLARLKHALRVSKDGEVAAALGLGKTAFSERKRRGSFPEDELRELARKQPDLRIDVNYVLTGNTGADTAWEAAAEPTSLAAMMIRNLESVNGPATRLDQRQDAPIYGIDEAVLKQCIELLLEEFKAAGIEPTSTQLAAAILLAYRVVQGDRLVTRERLAPILRLVG